MSKSTLNALSDKPVAIDTSLAKQKREEFEDCTPCRLMGATAFIGMGWYTHYSGVQQLQVREREILKSGSRFGMGARRMGIAGLSVGLVGAGVYRLFME